MLLGGMAFLWFIIMALIVTIPFWKIFQKAGYNGALALLMLVPIANIIIIYYLGFADWPALRRTQPPQQ